MKRFIGLILITFIFALLSFGCEDDVNKTDPPKRVQIVLKSAEDDTLEKGIDAVFDYGRPLLNSIFIEWHPNSEKKLAGYSIYRSESIDKNYVSIGKNIKILDIIDTTFTDNTVNLDQRYYYYIRAFDELDQFGDPSDTATYMIKENPILLSPAGNIGTNHTPIFIWNFDTQFVPNDFIIRIVYQNSNGAYKNFYTKETNIGVEYIPHQEWDLTELTQLLSLASGRYRWRIDPLGSEPFQGAESDWLEFTIQ